MTNSPAAPVIPRETYWMAGFLLVLEKYVCVNTAARSVKIARSVVYYQRRHNEAFRAAWDAALRRASAREARRALERASQYR